MIQKMIQIGKKLNRNVRNILIYLSKNIPIYYFSFFPNNCRYFPSCSEYSINALKKFGIFKGSYLTIIRILKCNPIFDSKFDPIPDKRNKKISSVKDITALRTMRKNILYKSFTRFLCKI